MYHHIEIASILADLMKLLPALDEFAPSRFSNNIRNATTTGQLYDAACDLGYAASSKELRDTRDESIHILCDTICGQVGKLDVLCRIRLSPGTPGQQRDWENSARRDASAKYAFRKDGSVETSLLDSTLRGNALNVKRVWSHVGSFSGFWTDFSIQLDAAQAQEYRRKLEESRLIQIALDGLRGKSGT